jgi:hypothetical protein
MTCIDSSESNFDFNLGIVYFPQVASQQSSLNLFPFCKNPQTSIGRSLRILTEWKFFSALCVKNRIHSQLELFTLRLCVTKSQ